MSTLHELIREHECDDPADTAAAVMDAIKLPTKYRDLFFVLLRDECRRQARTAVRIIEQANGGTIAEASPSEPASRSSLLDKGFHNGTTWVSWGEATVEDHEGRIAMQAAFRAGIDRDIDMHRTAIHDITSAGVTCLNDLGLSDWPVAA